MTKPEITTVEAALLCLVGIGPALDAYDHDQVLISAADAMDVLILLIGDYDIKSEDRHWAIIEKARAEAEKRPQI